MALLKTEVPLPERDGTVRRQVEQLYDYLNQLQNSLNFVLTNLGAANLNGADLRIPVKSGDGKKVLGSLGVQGGGVGLASGESSVTVDEGAVTLRRGKTGLRLTEDRVEITTDGETWRELSV